MIGTETRRGGHSEELADRMFLFHICVLIGLFADSPVEPIWLPLDLRYSTLACSRSLS